MNLLYKTADCLLKAACVRATLLLLCTICSLTAMSQGTMIASGSVVDKQGTPVTGATIAVKNSSNGTTANAGGQFKLDKLSAKDTLVISFIGYQSVEVPVSTKNFNIILQDSSINIEEVMVSVGYGYMKKRDLTGAITSLSSSDIEDRVGKDVYESIQGQAPGVQIVTNSGAPGEGASVKIRGTSTFGSGASPLYIVDGQPIDNLDLINPNDIESVEILKDAASAAIYGSRSANGVILLTTKKGSTGKTKLDVRYLQSYNSIANCIDLTTPQDFRYYDQVRSSLGASTATNTSDPYRAFLNSNVNILDYIFRTSVKRQVDISASNATDKMKYYGSIGYLHEDGVVVNSGYDRLTARLNFEYEASKRLRVGHRFSGSYGNQKGLYSENNVLSYLYDWVPYWNIFMADGEMMHNIDGRNSALTYATKATNLKQSINASIFNFVEFKIHKNLIWTSNLSGSFNMNRTEQYKPSMLIGTSSGETTVGSDQGYYTYNYMNENYLNYSLSKGDHSFTALVGNSTQFWKTDMVRVTGQDYTTDALYTLNFASLIDTKNTSSTINEHSLMSFFGRATYAYKGKYLFAANVRSDASSRFGHEKKWGTFPSASVGWRFSDEKFMKWSKGVLSDAKLRVSYGVTGNEAIGNYDSYMIYDPGGIYEGVAGIAPNKLGNPVLSWEKTAQTNIGIDIALFKNRWSITADYYDKQTTDLLYQTQMPKETGYTTITRNVGAMQNRGFEFVTNARIINKKNWKWDVVFNIATNNSIVKKLADGVPFYADGSSSGNIFIREGERIGEFYGYAHDGIFQYDQSNAFTPDWKQLTPIFDKGIFLEQYMYEDRLYTGEIKRKTYSDGTVFKGGDVNWLEAPASQNGVIDSDDRVILGCAQPDFYGGINSTLTWKNLSLFVSAYYSIGGSIYNAAQKSRDSFQRQYTSPSPEAIHNMWTRPGDIATYPAPVDREYNRLGPSDLFIEDASYIKLRNVKLTYRLPGKIAGKAMLRNASIYVYANNLLTFTAYKGFDPEFSGSNALNFGIDRNRYPRKKEFGFGVNLTF